jgi:hypothetical protein
MKVYHDSTDAMVSPKIWRAFHALWHEFGMIRESPRPLFDEEKLRGGAGLPELWSVDFPLDRLPGRLNIMDRDILRCRKMRKWQVASSSI